MSALARANPNHPELWGEEAVCQSCGESPCECREPWFATDDRGRDLPAHMERWNAEARGAKA